jgi:uncharacterized protein with von Willebrand factor type A (vWA) domain
MIGPVLRFVAGARAAGLRISTSEVLDGIRHLTWIDLLEEPQFKAVLRANFAKSRREQAHFERLYRLFFHELRQDLSIARSPSLAGPIQSVVDEVSAAAGEDPAARALLDFLRGDPAALLAEIRQAGEGAGAAGESAGRPGAGLAAVTRRLALLGRLNALSEALAEAVAGRRPELGWEERRDLLAHFRDRLDTARRLLGEGAAAPPEDLPAAGTSYRRQLDALGDVHFVSLTSREVEAMREAIELMVRRLKDKIGLRYAARRRGVLDVKKTLRRAAATQGIPLEVFYRRRPPRKAKIVTLCDVSGSVWSAARFMLNMLYSLQECFTQVRSYIFVAGIAEVTGVFDENEVNPAIDKILKEADLDYNAATDYGRTFREFRRRHMDILDKKTTLIVIGDGRSNYTHPEDGILAEMRERSRRLIWLNPETEQFWNSGDSEMRCLGAVCDEVRPCQNLNQLMEFISALVL